jgi:hypothetical protein
MGTNDRPVILAYHYLTKDIMDTALVPAVVRETINQTLPSLLSQTTAQSPFYLKASESYKNIRVLLSKHPRITSCMRVPAFHFCQSSMHSLGPDHQ